MFKSLVALLALSLPASAAACLTYKFEKIAFTRADGAAGQVVRTEDGTFFVDYVVPHAEAAMDRRLSHWGLYDAQREYADPQGRHGGVVMAMTRFKFAGTMAKPAEGRRWRVEFGVEGGVTAAGQEKMELRQGMVEAEWTFSDETTVELGGCRYRALSVTFDPVEQDLFPHLVDAEYLYFIQLGFAIEVSSGGVANPLIALDMAK